MVHDLVTTPGSIAAGLIFTMAIARGWNEVREEQKGVGERWNVLEFEIVGKRGRKGSA